jgi:hypothetical protein
MTFSILSSTNVDIVDASYLLSSPSISPTNLSLLIRSFSMFYLNSSICLLVLSFSDSCSLLSLSLLAYSIFLFFAILPLDPEFSPSSSSITLSWILSSIAPLFFCLLEDPRLASAACRRFESSAIELVEFLSYEVYFLLGVRFSLLNMMSS